MADNEGIRRRKLTKSRGNEKVSKENAELGKPGVCKRLLRVLILVTVALTAFLCYAYVTSPIASTVIADAHDVSKIKLAYANNSDLVRGRKILLELHGPESIAVDADGTWYTGLEDGRLVKITDGGKVTQKVTYISEMPDFSGGKRTKRRPLGLRLHGRKLYVADGYQGLLSFDLKDWTWEKIVGYDDVSPPMALTDDLAISKDGKVVYFTDASSRWMLDQVAYSIIEGECSGRVFKVDLHSKTTEEIRGGLCFANGIQLNPQETELLISETSRNRIIAIDINSSKIIKTILLHGAPDNIRPRRSGGYWVALPSLHVPIIDFLQDYPFLRDIIAKILGRDGIFKLAKLHQGTVIRLNEKYEIASVYYDRDGKICQAITEVQELDNGHLLLGSFAFHGIVQVNSLGSS